MKPQFVLVLPAVALFALPLSGQAPQGAGEDSRTGLVVSSGFVEARRIASGEPFPVWISFENRSGGEVHDLHFVDFRTAGLERYGNCWSLVNEAAPNGPKFPSCIPSSANPAQASRLPDSLSPGEALTVTGNLVRTAKSGEFMLTGVYAWTDSKGQGHRSVIPLGPIEVTKDWEDVKARIREALPLILKEIVIPFLKDLAWPVAFFLLGVMFKAGELRRTAVQQTWNQMLPQVHEHTTKYYLLLSSAAASLVDYTEKKIEKITYATDPDAPFYFLALLFRRMRSTNNDIGGFYLKDRDGEDVVVGAWDIFFDEFVESFPDQKGLLYKEVLVDSISDRESLQEYKRKLSIAPDYRFPFPGRDKLADVQEGFKKWIETEDFKDLLLPLLKIFHMAIDYEINRPYDTWYAKPLFFDAKAVLEQEKELGRWLEKKSRTAADPKLEARIEPVAELRKKLRRYLCRNAGRTKPWGTRWLVRWWYELRARGEDFFTSS